MATQALGERLAALRRAGVAEEAGKLVVIYPGLWPDDARNAYDAACAACAACGVDISLASERGTG